MPTIRIGSAEHELSDVLENTAQYARALERAKTIQGFAECGCRSGRPRPKIEIRRHGTTFVLTRWRRKGHEHAPGCPFHQRDQAGSTRSGSALDPFQVRDGHLDVRLDLSMRVAGASAAAPTRTTRAELGQSGTHRRAAPLLAFLEYAWEAAGLHCWPGHGPRGWSACWSMLTAGLVDCHINGQPASDTLHVMRRWEAAHKDEIRSELAAFYSRVTHHQRGLIIGEIETIEPSQHGWQLVLRQSSQRYYLSKELHQKLTRSYAVPLSGLGRTDLRCVAILAVERSRGGYLTVVDMAAMLANSAFLPCDSSHEVVMANHLIAHHRVFEKPLRHTGGAKVHPDFVLHDTHPPTVIEVYGMTGDPEYDQRKTEKRAYYRAMGIPVIEWIPIEKPVIAVLLPAARKPSVA